MATINVTVPRVGLTIEEVEVSHWLVDVGDLVADGDDIVEVDADKTTVAVVAPAAGVIKQIVASAGGIVPVGGLLATIET